MFSTAQIIGYIAVCFSSIAPITQLYQIHKTKKVRDLNPYFFGIRIISETLYILYGVFVSDYVMIASTAIPGSMEIVILILWCKYCKNPEIENNMNEIIV